MTDKITSLARTLRKRQTGAESLLWRHLRLRQMEGFKFRRQSPIDDYIADFVCLEKRLVIEVDGGRHAFKKVKDGKRDEYFRENGFKVLRFWNNDVFGNLEGCGKTRNFNDKGRGSGFTLPLFPSRQGRGCKKGLSA